MPPARVIHLRLAGEKRIAEDLESPRILLATSTLERVNRPADPYINKSDFFQHLLPGCTRQTTSNSCGPEIDVADRGVGNRLTVRDISELQIPARAQHAVNLLQHHVLVGAKVDHTIADDHVGPAVRDR